MIQMAKKMSCFLLLLISINGMAQKNNANFKVVDEYVQSLGRLDSLNMGSISFTVTKKFGDPKDKVRAIFDWIAYNISVDCKAAKNNSNDKSNSESILKNRKTTAAGYATLFQDMCSVVKIRCLTVDGYLKNKTEYLTEQPDEMNHTWAVVQLGQSPENWHYVDPMLGSGYTDEKCTVFTKAYNDAYFFADKEIFNYQHYPDNTAWILGRSVGGIKSFFARPILFDAAYDFTLSNFLPATGFIKTTTTAAVVFSLTVKSLAPISIVALAIGEAKKKKIKTVDYTIVDGSIQFTYPFKEEASVPVTVLINNEPVVGYFIEVEEK